MKTPPRCPICGQEGGRGFDPDRMVWGCWCTGTPIRFRYWCHPDAMSPDLEWLRQRYIRDGFGWSWFRPWNSPVFVLSDN